MENIFGSTVSIECSVVFSSSEDLVNMITPVDAKLTQKVVNPAVFHFSKKSGVQYLKLSNIQTNFYLLQWGGPEQSVGVMQIAVSLPQIAILTSCVIWILRLLCRVNL